MNSDELVRSALKGQYHPALAMLREGLERCPDEIWFSSQHVNAVWQIGYHTLFFAHLYLQPNVAAFRPWKHHQSEVQHEDAMTAPTDPNSTLPLLPEPYTREQVLEYCGFCERMVDEAVDTLDLNSTESGFSWYKVSKLEHQIINIRHIQLGAAHLAARLRAEADIGLRWVGSR